MAVDHRPAGSLGLGQPSQASGGVALAPDADLVVVQPDQLGDPPVGVAIGSQQHDPGPGDVALWGGVTADTPFQLGSVLFADNQWRQPHPCSSPRPMKPATYISVISAKKH